MSRATDKSYLLSERFLQNLTVFKNSNKPQKNLNLKIPLKFEYFKDVKKSIFQTDQFYN